MEKIVQQFRDLQPTLRKNEVWRHVDFAALLSDELQLPKGERQTAEYHCNIPNLDAVRMVTENGYCYQPTQQTDEGTLLAGFRDYCSQRPDLIRHYFGKCCPNRRTVHLSLAFPLTFFNPLFQIPIHL